MKQNLVIVFTLCISSVLFAQKIPNKIFPESKTDRLDISNLKDQHLPDSLLRIVKIKKDITVIQIPNAKPKDSSIYSSLKGKARNDDDYKILNVIPENEKLEHK